MLFSSIINYTKKSLRPHGLGDFSVRGVFLQPLFLDIITENKHTGDRKGENFYHGFMLGLCALLGDFFVTSNRESGEGRYDIQLKPLK